MEMISNNFSTLENEQLLLIDGGDFWRHLGYAGATVCCVGAMIATGPVAIAGAGAAAVWYWYDATR